MIFLYEMIKVGKKTIRQCSSPPSQCSSMTEIICERCPVPSGIVVMVWRERETSKVEKEQSCKTSKVEEKTNSKENKV